MMTPSFAFVDRRDSGTKNTQIESARLLASFMEALKQYFYIRVTIQHFMLRNSISNPLPPCGGGATHVVRR